MLGFLIVSFFTFSFIVSLQVVTVGARFSYSFFFYFFFFIVSLQVVTVGAWFSSSFFFSFSYSESSGCHSGC